MVGKIVSAVAGLLAAVALAGCAPKDTLSRTHGVDLTDSSIGKDFSLKGGVDGRTYRLADFRGKVVLVFFGFTQCPDICPTALFRAAEVKRLLAEDGDRLQVVFVTVDPERDTPDVLDAYTAAFDPSFLGLYGTPDDIARTAREFRVFYQKVPTGSSYTMDHSALSYVYDRQGRLRLALKHEEEAEAFASDIRKVMALPDA